MHLDVIFICTLPVFFEFFYTSHYIGSVMEKTGQDIKQESK